jgi:PAS domain S-box-containing protein
MSNRSGPSLDELVRGRYVPSLLAGLILAVSLLITYALWSNAQQSALKDLQSDFDFRAQETTQHIAQRMATYQQVLRGTKGFLLGSIEVKRDEFRAYVAALRLAEYYPGIQAIAISEIVPEQQKNQHIESIRRQGFPEYSIKPSGERDFYTSITQIEPFNLMNQRAFGYDMFSEPVRRAAMEKARDSGRTSLSGIVTLVQEAQTNVQPGFLMYMSIYKPGMPTNTVEERRAAIAGWVYAPFRVNDFMAGLGGERFSNIKITIYDGEVTSTQACLFSCANIDSGSALFKTTKRITIAGRPWTLDIRSEPAFEAQMDRDKPRLIAIAGVGVSLLLGLLVWLLASARSRALALALDMTRELRSSHNQIAAEQQRMKVIIENSHDAFVAIDTNGSITDWNTQAERTFGWMAGEAIGKDLATLIIPHDQREAHNVGLRRFATSGTGPVINNRIELMALHRSGKDIPVELAVAAIKSEAGYTSNAFIRDITERKEAERREAQRQQALEDARIALQHSQKLEAVGKLTGGVAHDFNNVLQIISGSIQLLLSNNDSREQREKRLHIALSAVERGSKLSSQLLAFARRQPLQPRVINIGRLVRNMDGLLRRALGESIEIETIVGGGLWNTLVDPNQLENVILNLTINARDAMKGAGKLTIELGNGMLDDEYVLSQPEVRPGQYVVLAISDTGSGMTAEVMEHVFEPFFTTKPEGEGTGLGLSMAYGFVKQSGGHIRLYSEIGHGTTVRIYLPRSLDLEEDIPSSSNDPIVGGTETILVVEDDIGVQATVVAMLTELGYRVLKADNGENALAIIKSGEMIDLLFTDVVMPGTLRSPDLAKQAKTVLPNIAVLFTSGYTQNAIVHGGRLDPGVDLLSKPYRREQLARKIRHVIANQQQAAIKNDSAAITITSGLDGNKQPATERQILVVEDNDDLRQLACELLSILGHKPHGVASAEEALKALPGTQYDILFTDVGLPGMNGVQLAEQALKTNSRIKVIFATGYGDTLQNAEALRSLVLKKPYNISQLQKALE